MNSATQLSLAERDLDHARLAIGAQRDARLDACNARLMPLPADLQPGRQAILLRDLAIDYYLKGDRGAAAMGSIAKACLLLSPENDTAALRRCRSIQCLILTENGDFAGAGAAGAAGSAFVIPLGRLRGARRRFQIAFVYAPAILSQFRSHR